MGAMKANQLLTEKGSPNSHKVANRFEDVLQDCIKELQRIESNLRVKGDIWRAERVKKFRIENFGEN
jgi:hypothetical protein